MASQCEQWESNHVHDTLIGILRHRAIEQPNQLAYTLLSDGEAEEQSLTYASLDRRARAIGAWLRSISAPGERALLLYPMGLEFIAAFFGCIYAGVIAVPGYSVNADNLQSILRRIDPLIADSGAMIALTDQASLTLVKQAAQNSDNARKVQWVATETVPDEIAPDWQSPPINSKSLALLQYTSGSTSAPKGVMISHRNLLWRGRQEAIERYPQSTRLTWRPIVNTGGLYMGVILPLISGERSILMPPEAFLQKPIRWLQAISRYRVASSGGPNFGYELCVSRIQPEARSELDLTSWTAAFVVAEHIDPVIINRFADAFGPCGFHREAFAPCYGLTEMTGLVSLSPISRGPKVIHVKKVALRENNVVLSTVGDSSTRSLVSCGKVVVDRLLIVDPITKRECPLDRLGEIWAASASGPQGYWNKPEETENTFHAFLDGGQEGPFLRTGDLGFVHDSELFVTGRIKDSMIIRGRNLYPQDIELTVAKSHKAFGPASTVVFSIESPGEERVVVVQELQHWSDRDLNEMVEGIRRSVFDDHEVLAYTVVLVRAGSIPRAAEPGKLQRQACRAAFIDNKLDIIRISTMGENYPDYSRPPRVVTARTATEKALAGIWSTILGLETIGIYDNFVDLGGHSILATQCLNRVRSTFEVDLPIAELFSETANIRELAEEIDKRKRHNDSILPNLDTPQSASAKP